MTFFLIIYTFNVYIIAISLKKKTYNIEKIKCHSLKSFSNCIHLYIYMKKKILLVNNKNN